MVSKQSLCSECGRRIVGVCTGPHPRLAARAARETVRGNWTILPKPAPAALVPKVVPRPAKVKVRGGALVRATAKPPKPPVLRDELSTRVQSALAERYQGSVVPRGTTPLLAAEFGVSRQRISQILQSSGRTVARPPARPCPPNYECLCGRVQRGQDLCKECNVVELPCRHCQRPVHRTVPYLLALFRFKNSTTVFCNHACLMADAPRRFAQHRETLNRFAEFERFVLAIGPGEVGRLILTDGESPRSFKLRLARAAERLNVSVAVWSVEGSVYFRLVGPSSSDQP